MIKARNIRPVLLLAFIGIVLIALVEPIAANNMGQGNMGQTNMMNSGADKQTNMMPCMMGEQSANGTMIPCMMAQNASTSQAGPDCAHFWLQKAIMLHDLHMRDPKVAANESSQIELMNQMKRAYECVTGKNITENTTAGMMNQNAGTSQAGSDCASLWLKKAIELHNLHLSNSTAAANESSQMEMMNQMIQIYDCIPVNKTTIGMCQNDSIAQARLTCTDFWLQKAIKLHEVHLKDPSTATEESQMEMMNQMMLAHKCIKGEKMTTGMTNATESHASGGH